ncbi:MAG: bifunctional pyr operon transcriptional regulator/uracil phosphoribosyltransferase PyrR, partial [Acidimicrobiaceae bacterium]
CEARTEGKHESTNSHTRTPLTRGVFHAHTHFHRLPVSAVTTTAVDILGADDVSRAITRISHEIVERNPALDSVVIVGMQTGGTWIAKRLCESVNKIVEGANVPLGAIDISLYRDDYSLRPVVLSAPTDIPVDLTGRTVVLVDDVLFTGRTVRAALEALNDYGRPRAVQLAVMVDRGHRELPIRPDYVGKNIPTHFSDEVAVGPNGVTVSAVAT